MAKNEAISAHPARVERAMPSLLDLQPRLRPVFTGRPMLESRAGWPDFREQTPVDSIEWRSRALRLDRPARSTPSFCALLLAKAEIPRG
jgi:hypothetical protein